MRPRPALRLPLQAKLSLIFVLLLGTVGTVGTLAVLRSTDDYLAETEQRTNLTLAASIAREMNIDSATNAIAPPTIEQLFGAAMVINPNIKLYLVGLEGEMLGASAAPDEIRQPRVDVAPIRQLLRASPRLPIWGDDPREPDRPKVFSAALLLNHRQQPHCYLYVVLGNGQAHGSARATSQRNFVARLLGQGLLLALAATLLAGLLLMAVLNRNLGRLMQAVERLQAGDLSVRVHIDSGDELAELGAAFNAMTTQIEEALQALRNNDQLRRELVANISHDLRTPLASIEGYLETILLREHLLSEEEKKGYLRTIHKNTHRLRRLVGELFELSKLEARQVTPQSEVFSVAELAQDILVQFEPTARARQVQLLPVAAHNCPFALGDIGLIERVLQNLIANAIEYTPAGGEVSVCVQTAPAQGLWVSVSDTGKGISSTDLPHIFDRFYRSDQVRQRVTPGLGLGLAIAKKILELHQSDLQVTSQPGVGTTFSFWLPCTSG